MKLLLTGKDGQVSFERQHTLAPLAEIVAVDQVEFGLSNLEAIRQLIRQVKPDRIGAALEC